MWSFRRGSKERTVTTQDERPSVTTDTIFGNVRLGVRAIITRADGTVVDLGEVASSDDGSAYLITDEDSI